MSKKQLWDVEDAVPYINKRKRTKQRTAKGGPYKMS